MNIHSSYFEVPTLGSLLRRLDRLLNPYRHRATVTVRGNPAEIRWTDRAQQALNGRALPLVAEMQLYFSCVVKKRVLFHEQAEGSAVTVNERLQVQFRPVESTACDPVAFAEGYPVKREFDSPAAARLKPSALEIDFVDGDWQGEFFIGASGRRA